MIVTFTPYFRTLTGLYVCGVDISVLEVLYTCCTVGHAHTCSACVCEGNM